MVYISLHYEAFPNNQIERLRGRSVEGNDRTNVRSKTRKRVAFSSTELQEPAQYQTMQFCGVESQDWA
jgi:hypothetical protein